MKIGSIMPAPIPTIMITPPTPGRGKLWKFPLMAEKGAGPSWARWLKLGGWGLVVAIMFLHGLLWWYSSRCWTVRD